MKNNKKYTSILDTYCYNLKEEDLSLKLTEFLKEAIDVAIIFNDTGKSDSVSNSKDLDLVTKRLLSYFNNSCRDKKENQF